MIVKCLKRKTYFQASTRLEKNRHSLAFQKRHPEGFTQRIFYANCLAKFQQLNHSGSQWPVVVKNHIPGLLWRWLSQSKGHRTVTQRLKERFSKNAFGSSLKRTGAYKTNNFFGGAISTDYYITV